MKRAMTKVGVLRAPQTKARPSRTSPARGEVSG